MINLLYFLKILYKNKSLNNFLKVFLSYFRFLNEKLII